MGGRTQEADVESLCIFICKSLYPVLIVEQFGTVLIFGTVFQNRIIWNEAETKPLLLVSPQSWLYCSVLGTATASGMQNWWQKTVPSWVVAHAFNPSLGRQRQADLCEASLVYRASSKTAKLRQRRKSLKTESCQRCNWTRGHVPAPANSRPRQLQPCVPSFRVKDGRKGFMESPSMTKESRQGQTRGRGVHAWKPREAIEWSCEGEAWLPWRCQSLGILAKKSC